MDTQREGQALEVTLRGMAKRLGQEDRIRREIERKKKARLRTTGPYRKASLIHRRYTRHS
jgi:hypothetical protein